MIYGPKPPKPLSLREMEVLQLISEGHNNESIANQLNIARETVKRHIANTMKKQGCGSRLELAVNYLKAQFSEERKRWTLKAS